MAVDLFGSPALIRRVGEYGVANGVKLPSLRRVISAGAPVPAKVLDDLRSRGHVLRVLGPYAMSTGVVAVGVNPKTGTLRGGADPRRERYIFGW